MGESNYKDISLLFPGSLKRRYLYCSSVHFISISGEIDTKRDSEDRESKREAHRDIERQRETERDREIARRTDSSRHKEEKDFEEKSMRDKKVHGTFIRW